MELFGVIFCSREYIGLVLNSIVNYGVICCSIKGLYYNTE